MSGVNKSGMLDLGKSAMNSNSPRTLLQANTKKTHKSKNHDKPSGEHSNHSGIQNMKVSFLGMDMQLSQIHEDIGDLAQSATHKAASKNKKNRSTFQMGDKFSQVVDDLLSNQGNSNIRASQNFEKLFKAGLPSKD